MVMMVATTGLLLLGDVGNDRLSGEQQAGDADSVLQCATGHLDRIDHTGGTQVDVLAGIGVIPEVLVFVPENCVDHHRTIKTCILRDHAAGSFQNAAEESGGRLLGLWQVNLVQHLAGVEQSHPAARNNTFSDGCPRGVQRILIKGLALFHFGFGRGAHLHLGHASGELGQALLQLLTVVIAVSLLDLTTDQLAAAFQRLLVACTLGDGGVFAVDAHFLGAAQIGQLDGVERNAQILEDRLALGQRGDVFQHRFTAITVAGGLHRTDIHHTLQLVQHQGGKSLTFDILGDDHQRGLGLADLLQQGHQILGVADLLFVDEDVWVVELDNHLILVGDEVGRQVAAVELHTLDDGHLGVGSLAFFDGDHAIAGADLLHGLGQLFADFAVVVGGDGRHLGNALLVVGVNLLGHRAKAVDHLAH